MSEFHAFEKAMQRLTDEDIPEVDFCTGRAAFEWTIGTKPQVVHAKKDGDYESQIEGFLSYGASPKASGHNNILVIVGGTGEGKSTILNRSLRKLQSKTRTCEKQAIACTHPPKTILIDFRYLESNPVRPVSENAFWSYLASQVTKYIDVSDAELPYFVRFWHWCFTKGELVCNSHVLQSFLIENRDAISGCLNNAAYMGLSGSDLIQYLDRRRGELFRSMQPKDLAWHQLALLGFCLVDDEECACPIFALDNVDHLPPALQSDAVELAVSLGSILESKVIIAIRPLTWSQAVHGQYVVEQKTHYAPSAKEVLDSRFKVAREQTSDVFALQCIDKVESLLKNPRTKLPTMLEATSGLSIRFALRNVYNMLQSPILRQYLRETSGLLSVTEVARSFFFGERGQFLDHAFDNLYVVNRRLNPELVLLKIRILDYISRIRGGVAYVRDVFKFIGTFGFDGDDVESALSELLHVSRPLLWSSEGWDVSSPESQARILVTPIGLGYVNTLFGEMFYLEACLADNRDEAIEPSQVLNFDREISAKDLKEISTFSLKKGSDQYIRYYGDIGGLSLAHFRNLYQGMIRVARRYQGNLMLDESRDEYLRVEIEKILDAPLTIKEDWKRR